MLIPAPLGLTEASEGEDCIHEYGRWIAYEHEAWGLKRTWPITQGGVRILMAAEAICAPIPADGGGKSTK